MARCTCEFVVQPPSGRYVVARCPELQALWKEVERTGLTVEQVQYNQRQVENHLLWLGQRDMLRLDRMVEEEQHA